MNCTVRMVRQAENIKKIYIFYSLMCNYKERNNFLVTVKLSNVLLIIVEVSAKFCWVKKNFKHKVSRVKATISPVTGCVHFQSDFVHTLRRLCHSNRHSWDSFSENLFTWSCLHAREKGLLPSSCQSVCQHVSVRLPTVRISVKFDIGNCYENLSRKSRFCYNRGKDRALYVNTQVRLIVAGDINSP